MERVRGRESEEVGRRYEGNTPVDSSRWWYGDNTVGQRSLVWVGVKGPRGMRSGWDGAGEPSVHQVPA